MQKDIAPSLTQPISLNLGFRPSLARTRYFSLSLYFHYRIIEPLFKGYSLNFYSAFICFLDAKGPPHFEAARSFPAILSGFLPLKTCCITYPALVPVLRSFHPSNLYF